MRLMQVLWARGVSHDGRIMAAATCLTLLAVLPASACDDGWGAWYADRAEYHSDWADYYGRVASWYASWGEPGAALYYEGLTDQQSWEAGWYSSYDASFGSSDSSHDWSDWSSGPGDDGASAGW